MKTLLLPAAVLAMLLAPAAADAAQCRNAKGQFAKCGAPGAMSDAQYKAMKGKPMMMAPKPGPMMAAKPAPMMAAKPAMSSSPMMAAKPAPMMAAKPAMAPKPMMMGSKPAMMAAKAPCKDAKGKFIKCK